MAADRGPAAGGFPPAAGIPDRPPRQFARGQGRAETGIRSTASVAVFAALVFLCAALLADAIVRGRWDTALASVPAVAFVLWGAWLVFARPGLRLHDHGLTIVNVLRTTTVPWGEVDDIVLRHQVTVVTRSGARLVCWGVPSSARPSARSAGGTSRTAGPVRESSGRISGSPAHRAIRGYWDRHETPQRAGERPVTRWNRRSLLVGALLVLGLAGQLAAATLG